MTKLDLVLDRIRKLPPERQDAVAVEIDFLLDSEESDSLLSDEEWAAIEPTLDEDDGAIPHHVIVERMRKAFPG